jgi:hypothetical protein
VRLLSADDRVITEVIPGINFELLVEMELISAFAPIPFTFLVMDRLFPVEFSRHVKNFLVYAMFCLVRAMIHKKEGSLIIGICIAIVLIFYCIQIAFYNYFTTVNLGSNSLWL